jgi:hypothetical protein
MFQVGVTDLISYVLFRLQAILWVNGCAQLAHRRPVSTSDTFFMFPYPDTLISPDLWRNIVTQSG